MNATIEDISMAPLRVPEMLALDMMHLGTGAAEGSKLGVAEDVLRLLSVTPVGKVVRGTGNLLVPFVGSIAQRLFNFAIWRQVRGGVCGLIAAAQAMQRTGSSIVVPLAEIAKKAGRPLDAISRDGMNIVEIAKALRGLGAHVSETSGRYIRTWQELATHARGVDGVTLAFIGGIRNGKPVGHFIVVGRGSGGSIQIFDRAGVFSTLDDLSRRYRVNFQLTNEPILNIGNWALDPALANQLDKFGPLAAVVVRVAAMITLNPSVPVARLQADFDAFLADRNTGPLPPNPSPGPPPASDVMAMHYVPAQGAMLSKVSMSYYGTHHMWPLIWDANRELIGPNPNRVPKEIYLRILKQHVYTAAQLAEAKRRSLNWKSYN
ncbi:hypothetical protein [Bosea sp. (in: a-proteobacteria)]|uniref:hypothetical protein n=1 Tax=Bosea sp. (in: a-proteobacteria) TaxID=1871050 RepID=UPI003F6EC1D0